MPWRQRTISFPSAFSAHSSQVRISHTRFFHVACDMKLLVGRLSYTPPPTFIPRSIGSRLSRLALSSSSHAKTKQKTLSLIFKIHGERSSFKSSKIYTNKMQSHLKNITVRAIMIEFFPALQHSHCIWVELSNQEQHTELKRLRQSLLSCRRNYEA